MSAQHWPLLSGEGFKIVKLVVWSELLTGTGEVTLDLGGLHGKVRVYDPTSGTTATQTPNNVHSVRLTLSDHPVVIELP